MNEHEPHEPTLSTDNRSSSDSEDPDEHEPPFMDDLTHTNNDGQQIPRRSNIIRNKPQWLASNDWTQ